MNLDSTGPGVNARFIVPAGGSAKQVSHRILLREERGNGKYAGVRVDSLLTSARRTLTVANKPLVCGAKWRGLNWMLRLRFTGFSSQAS
jgi:hypothetical protein